MDCSFAYCIHNLVTACHDGNMFSEWLVVAEEVAMRGHMTSATRINVPFHHIFYIFGVVPYISHFLGDISALRRCWVWIMWKRLIIVPWLVLVVLETLLKSVPIAAVVGAPFMCISTPVVAYTKPTTTS